MVTDNILMAKAKVKGHSVKNMRTTKCIVARLATNLNDKYLFCSNFFQIIKVHLNTEHQLLIMTAGSPLSTTAGTSQRSSRCHLGDFEIGGIYYSVTEASVWILLSIATVSLNGVSLVGLMKKRQQLKVYELHIASLLVSDFLIGLIVHSSTARYTWSPPKSCILAKIGFFVGRATVYISIFTIALIARERFKGVVCRYSSKGLNHVRRRKNALSTHRKTVTLILLIWFGCLLYSAIALLLPDVIIMDAVYPVVLLVIIIYSLITLRKLPISRATNGSGTERTRITYCRIARKMTLALLVSYSVTLIPVIFVWVLTRMGVIKENQLVRLTTAKIHLIAPLLDPIIYLWLSPKQRTSIVESLHIRNRDNDTNRTECTSASLEQKLKKSVFRQKLKSTKAEAEIEMDHISSASVAVKTAICCCRVKSDLPLETITSPAASSYVMETACSCCETALESVSNSTPNSVGEPSDLAVKDKVTHDNGESKKTLPNFKGRETS